MFTGINHYVLFVKDLAASHDWYTALGMPYVHGGDHGHFFALPGGGQLMLHPSETGRPEGSTPQLYVTVGDLDAALVTHRVAGMEAFSPNGEGEVPVTTPWGTREYCVRDPDGHIWGIVQA